MKKLSKKRCILLSIVFIIFLAVIMLKTVYLGYDIFKKKDTKTVELGIPKLSFIKKLNDRSYSFKNIRGEKVLKKEVTAFLNTLDKQKCNHTIYYYDKENDFTIVDYEIKNNFLYHTISYEVRYGSYCYQQKLNEYTKKLGGLMKFHTLYGRGIHFPVNEVVTPRLVVTFLDRVDLKKQETIAELQAYYLTPNSGKNVNRKELETSSGTYEIKGNRLYYTRTEISQKSDDIVIPKVSVFELREKELILLDNYLSKYEQQIVLK